MRHGMGQAGGGDGFWSWGPWALIGAGVGYGLYMLLRPRLEAGPMPRETRAAPVAPVAPPSRFADLASVRTRFGQVKELYRMGYLSPLQTLDELDALSAVANTFGARSADEALEANILIDAIASFRADVEAFIRESALAGTKFPVVNRGSA